MRHRGLAGLVVVMALVVPWETVVGKDAESEQNREELRWEVGGHFTALNFSRWDVVDPAPTYRGFGGRISLNLTRNFAVEVESAYLPDFAEQKFLLLAGGKLGFRSQHLGLYGKVRPGVMLIRDRFFCGFWDCPPPERKYNDKYHFALDTGGVVEIYQVPFLQQKGPAAVRDRLFLRFDASHLMVPFTSRYSVEIDGISIPIETRSTRHGFTVSFGAGFRF
jgi:hypothetical protein